MSDRIMRAVADLASQIEPDKATVFCWITNSRIPALGNRTPFEAALDGEGDLVIEMLRDILAMSEDLITRLSAKSRT